MTEAPAVTFQSVRGRIYTTATVLPLLLRILGRRWGTLAKPGWRDRVRAALADERWIRWRRGCTPEALAADLDQVVTAERRHGP